MIVHIYKNHNFTVQFEPKFDPALPKTVPEFIEQIHNNIDAPDVCAVEESYPGYYVQFFVNGAPRYYQVLVSDLEKYIDGYTVRFIYESDAPLFYMPSHFDAYPFDIDGQKGILYKLCDKTIEQTTLDAMLACGCKKLNTSPLYAPEIVHTAIFVPNGTCFDFA